MAADTIPGVLAAAAERYGDATAIEDGALQLTFAALRACAQEACAAFCAAGVEPGDRVAIWAPNTWEWIVSALGAHCAGAAVVPLNTRYKGAEAADILRRSGARALVTVAGFLGTDYVAALRDAAGGAGDDRPVEDLAALETVIVLRGPAPPGAVPFDDFLEAGAGHLDEAAARATAVGPDDLSDILFTSGTTGRSKGVMTTHAQNLRCFRAWIDRVGLREGDRYLVVNPFFHAFGYKAGWLSGLICGATVLPQPVFDPAAVLRRIAPDRVSVLPGPPALYQTFLQRDDLADFDLSPLRLAVTGAAVVPVSLVEQMRTVLGFDTVITGYGLTESCGVVTMCATDDDDETIATRCGRALDGVEVRIAGPDGATLPAGEDGEVQVRGYNVMRGYLDDPEATAAAVEPDGWLHTGDIGVLDERGYLRITDRLKDMYICGGFNCYPAEIERQLAEHPDVAEVAVIGVPDERLGEVGCAVVAPRAGAVIDGAEIIAWARERMANFKVPRQVRTIEALPRNALGKVQKYLLRSP